MEGIGGGLRAGLLERLFQHADRNRNQSVGVDEIAALLSGDTADAVARTVVADQDQNGDGELTLAEFAHGRLASETMTGLLSAQEYAEANRSERRADDQRAVEALFARADLDGDGFLSQEEFDAERVLQFARSLDTGEAAPQHMLMAFRRDAGDGKFSKDEILVGRRLVDMLKPVSLDDPNFDPEWRERLKALRPVTPANPDPDAAPIAERPSVTEVLSDAVRSAELTETLIARLIQQLERATATPPTQDIQV